MRITEAAVAAKIERFKRAAERRGLSAEGLDTLHASNAPGEWGLFTAGEHGSRVAFVHAYGLREIANYLDGAAHALEVLR